MITPNQDSGNTSAEKKSTSETGHARNLAAFDKLLKIAERHQDNYTPAAADITIEAMKTLYADAKKAIDECNTAETNFDKSTTYRADLFKQLRPLSMKAINSFRSTNVTKSAIKNAETLIHKIQGRPAKVTKKNLLAAGSDAANSISTSQQSYVQLVEHFKGLCNVLANYPEYAPNEAEIQLLSLHSFANKLNDSTDNVNAAITNWSGARINRNRILYQPNTGMIDITKRIKKYIASKFTTTSPEYKEVSKIIFRNPD